ncbi:DUF3515 family protein [Microbacteriaceae bacterium VKM Ac-2855]|nr:DUF3515 family protein [Microbacteriaceae bacterium VKM Ac-2855]
MSSRSVLAIGGLLAAALLLSGCSASVALEPADDATNVACAAMSVRLPDEVAGQSGRETNAQATAAWGDPASIILHCGVAVPAPTTLLCVTYSDVDWIVDDSNDENGIYSLTTYGREPAVNVVIDQGKASAADALTELGSAVSVIPQTRACTAVGSGIEETPTSAPTP